MALFENRIQAFNNEGTIHELSAETLAVLDQAAASHGMDFTGMEPSLPPVGHTLEDAIREIRTVQGGIAILAAVPSPELHVQVQEILAAAHPS